MMEATDRWAPIDARRRNILRASAMLAVLGVVAPLTACGQAEPKVRNDMVFNVVMYSYVDRVITDITFNGTDLGVANKYGGTGTMTGGRIRLGTQTLHWTLDGPQGMARNGERVHVKNRLTMTRDLPPPGTRYIGLHLYPDDTAEITFAEFIPERTARGKALISARN